MSGRVDPKWFACYGGETYVHEVRDRNQLVPSGLEWRGAWFSPDRRYRTELRRTWDPEAPWVLFIGLNPSKAGAVDDDATVRLWRGFARRWGYGGFVAVNVYELVPDVDAWRWRVGQLASRADLVVACWGSGCAGGRQAAVKRLLTTWAYRSMRSG